MSGRFRRALSGAIIAGDGVVEVVQHLGSASQLNAGKRKSKTQGNQKQDLPKQAQARHVHGKLFPSRCQKPRPRGFVASASDWWLACGVAVVTFENQHVGACTHLALLLSLHTSFQSEPNPGPGPFLYTHILVVFSVTHIYL
jgi:hypothetical protein